MGVYTTGMTQEEYRKAAVDAVRQLSIDVGIPTKLEAIKEEDLEFLAQSAFADACAPGNTKAASIEDIKGTDPQAYVIPFCILNSSYSSIEIVR